MQLLDAIDIYYKDERKSIELYHGDLTAMEALDGMDILVISAFPDNYDPTPGTIIHALAQKGVHVGELAADKDEDLRENFSCWLSRPINVPGTSFDRILCWEPPTQGESPNEVVSNVFQAIMPFVNREDVRSATLASSSATGFSKSR